ncbi:MAG: universal stress protein [Thaumarchaeota archaeon]|nr:universal stress protein [Nitrososphaerota archaeon]MDG6994556.1 universal stress protein [Nitrososphaerota archaeon]
MKVSGKYQGIRRILVAVDGSENADRAVKVASRIAKDNNADLTVLHVILLPPAVYSGDVAIDIGKIESEARVGAEKIVSTASSLAEEEEVKPKTAVVQRMDSAARGITEYANENAIDLIVVGTRGLGGFKRLVLGSVASGVVHHAHCSVLIVR